MQSKQQRPPFSSGPRSGGFHVWCLVLTILAGLAAQPARAQSWEVLGGPSTSNGQFVFAGAYWQHFKFSQPYRVTRIGTSFQGGPHTGVPVSIRKNGVQIRSMVAGARNPYGVWTWSNKYDETWIDAIEPIDMQPGDTLDFVVTNKDFRVSSVGSTTNPSQLSGVPGILTYQRVGTNYPSYGYSENWAWLNLTVELVVDNTAPSTAIAITPAPPTTGWHLASPVGVALTATDNADGRGVQEIRYSVDMGTEQVVAGASASFPVNGDGIHTVAYWAVDKAGNAEPTRYATVKIDTTKPTTSATAAPAPNPAGWHKSAVTLNIAGNDASSGVQEIRTIVGAGAEQTTSGTSAIVVLATEGTHTVVHRAVDVAGNTGDSVSTTVQIDTTAPVPTATIAYGKLEIAATDNLSGVASVAYRIDSGAWTAYTGPVSLPLGAKVVAYRATDIAGNPSSDQTKFVGQFLKSITLLPSPVYAGSVATVKVDLLAAAPAGGIVLSLTSSHPGVLPFSGTLTVPAGATSASASVVAGPVSGDTMVQVVVGAGDTVLARNVAVLVPVVKTLAATPSVVVGGGTVNFKATLVGKAPIGGQWVELESLDPSVLQVPSAIVVAAGQTFKNFTGTVASVATDRSVLVLAKVDGDIAVCSVAVRRLGLTSLAFTPPSVVGGSSSTLNITLNRPAPAGGVELTFTTSGSGASVPGTVVVPGGATRVGVQVSTVPVTLEQGVVVRAPLGGGSARATLAIQPARLSTFSLAPGSISGGSTVTGTILLNGPAGPGGTVVKLATDRADILDLPASVTVPAGASSLTFSALSQSVTANTVVSVTAFQNLDSKTATITVLR